MNGSRVEKELEMQFIKTFKQGKKLQITPVIYTINKCLRMKSKKKYKECKKDKNLVFKNNKITLIKIIIQVKIYLTQVNLDKNQH